MEVLAIDPGNEQSAAVIWDNKTILFAEIMENNAMLSYLDSIPVEQLCCIEMVASYGMPVGKTVFETCVWIGRFMSMFSNEPELIYRKDVKMHICGQTRAKDSNIIQALKDRFGDKGTKKEPGVTYGLKKDLWQAFALAVYYFDTHKKETEEDYGKR